MTAFSQVEYKDIVGVNRNLGNGRVCNRLASYYITTRTSLLPTSDH